MAKKEVIEERAEALIVPILEAKGLSIVDTEYVKEGSDWFLRYYIDKAGGVTIGDCETVSRAVSDLLDEADFIDGAYILEVSSPGLGRPLKKEKDYVRNLGKEIEVRLFKAVGGAKEFVGTLDAFDKDTVTLKVREEKIVLERKNLSLVREYVDFDEIPKKEDKNQK